MFFRAKEQVIEQSDTYEQVKTLVTALLHYECPEHNPRHHLLYTTNQKLAHYGEARDYYRKQIDVATALGTFSRQAYETTVQQYNQLYLLIRAYMHLSDEAQRAHFNHHFSFSSTTIDTLFEQYNNKERYLHYSNLEQVFWQSLKDDFTPLLTQIE